MIYFHPIELDFILPIGSACQTRHQVERYLKEYFDLKQPACFFDWLGLGGVDGVYKMFERNFELSPSDFVVKSMFKDNHYTPIHLPTKFRFQHDFNSSVESRISEKNALSAMTENMETSLNKYKYLADRTNKVLNDANRVGLIYHGRTKLASVDNLLNLLHSKYDTKFYFINVLNVDNYHPLPSENIITLVVDNSSKKGVIDEWKGSNDSWDKILLKFVINKNFYLNFKN